MYEIDFFENDEQIRQVEALQKDKLAAKQLFCWNSNHPKMFKVPGKQQGEHETCWSNMFKSEFILGNETFRNGIVVGNNIE